MNKGSQLGDGPGQQCKVEIQVADAVIVAVETLLVALQIRFPVAGRLVEVVPAQVCANAGMHSGNESIENALLKTFVVSLEASVGNKQSVGVDKPLLLELLLAASSVDDVLEIHGRWALRPLRDAEVCRMRE